MARPHGGLHDLNPVLQLVTMDMGAESGSVLRIRLESDDLSSCAGGGQRIRADVSTDIVEHRAWPRELANCLLYCRFVLAPAPTTLSYKIDLEPQTFAEAVLHLHPVHAGRKQTTGNEPLQLADADRSWKTRQHMLREPTSEASLPSEEKARISLSHLS